MDFVVSPAMRNFSRPLAQRQTTEPQPLPIRPLRSPLRSLTGGPSASASQPVMAAPTTVQQRRRSRSIGALVATAQTLRDPLQSSASSMVSRKQRTYSHGAHAHTEARHLEKHVLLSSPSSPTTFLPLEDFVARGGPAVRDSLISSESSLYPETFEDDVRDSPDAPLPRIAHLNRTGFDPDNVSYRLDLLVNNQYFLPPAHAKPSANELASLTVQRTPPLPTKKAAILSPNGFRDLFRKSPAKSSAAIIQKPAPVVVTAPHVQTPPHRIVVLREQLVDFHQAVREAEQQHQRSVLVRQQTAPGQPASLNDIDPTGEVDVPPGTLAPDTRPCTPVLPEEERFRRDLLEQAVGLSFNGSSSPSTPRTRRSAEDRHHSDRRRQRSLSPHHARRPRTAETPPIPIAGPSSSDARSVRSLGVPTSPAHGIGSPIVSEASYFSSLPFSRPTAPTPSHAFAPPAQDSPVSDVTTPLSTPDEPGRLRRPIVDTFMEAAQQYNEYRQEETSPHTPLSPAPPPRKNSRATSNSAKSLHAPGGSGSGISVTGEPPQSGQLAFVVQVPGATSFVSLATVQSDGSIYSHLGEDTDTTPRPHVFSSSPPDEHTLISRAPSVGDRLSMDPQQSQRLSFDSHSSHRPSFDDHADTQTIGRPSFDARHLRSSIEAGSSARPSLSLSIGVRAAHSVQSLHSEAFGHGRDARTSTSTAASHMPRPRRDDDDARSVRSTRIRSARSYASDRTTPAPVFRSITPVTVAAPDSAGPAFFDEVQDRYMRQAAARYRDDSDDDDDSGGPEELVHLGAPPSMARAESPLPSPVYPATRMLHTEPVSSVTAAVASVAKGRKSRDKDKGLGMLQRAQAGSAVSLAASAHSFPAAVASDDGHGGSGHGHGDPRTRSSSSLGHHSVTAGPPVPPPVSTMPVRPKEDVRLDDLMVAHMSQERDRLKKIASEHGTLRTRE
ncbi:hypothetical protein BKA62DRAFT_787888 [Auriculariales sp. MPI-PUGE-AT-0066]|nr:hypothetical protein BKA62DRAFT_787888 [Auriculariales sp. MPI-PUGE-AT-0066]